MRLVGLSMTLVALAFGCETDHALVIDLVTDLEPGVELYSLRTEVLHSGGGETVTMDARFGQDFLGGQRIAELDGIGDGSTTTRVFLLGPVGEELLTRTIVVQVNGDTGFTVLATRSCAPVVCPDPAGDPLLTTCVGGRCVDEHCTVESSESCGTPGCMTDSDCGPASVACARQVCIGGECLQEGLDAMCGAGEYCDVTMGCAASPILDDAGTTPPDASGTTVVTFGEDGTTDFAGVTSDTTIVSTAPTLNSGTNASIEIEAGVSAALMHFDISSIPTTATVASAELEVWTNFSPSQGGVASVHVTTEAWDESSATWEERMAGVPWSMPGAERGPMLGTITTTNDMFFESLESRVPLDPTVVQQWVADPTANTGLIIAPMSGYVGLLSSEAVLIENAPILHVEYSP
jgi:hypothetical protein